jgi:hypothetical protein
MSYGHSLIGKSPAQAQRLLLEVKWGEEIPPQETVVRNHPMLGWLP